MKIKRWTIFQAMCIIEYEKDLRIIKTDLIYHDLLEANNFSLLIT